jgi:polygalacturonase
MKPKISFLIILFLTANYLGFAGNKSLAISHDITVTDLGIKADGKTDNTTLIQKAIDEISLQGGGVLNFPAGIYMSGSIALKDNVTLNLHKLAVLKGIASDNAYPGTRAFILIDNVSNVSIIGEGTIDGDGGAKVFQRGNNGPGRPHLVTCRRSKNIVFKDVRLQNSASWTLQLLGSDNVRIDGLHVYSHTNWNNDGIDIDSKNVIISNCVIDAQDDAICFKSDSKTLCENVVVSNCIVASDCNLIKFGTACIGGFKNITVSNCSLRAASESNQWKWYKGDEANRPLPGVTDSITGLAGIALEVVDGGIIDQITISNIVMTGVQTPLFIKLGNRKNSPGSLKNVLISNIVATSHSRVANSITGFPGFYVENVVIRDMIVNCMGGGTLEDANRVVPENEKAYPENRMFGNTLPAYGMYVRHARNIYLDNIQFNLLQPDARPAIWFDDAQDVTLRAFRATLPSGNQELIVKHQSSVKILE